MNINTLLMATKNVMDKKRSRNRTFKYIEGSRTRRLFHAKHFPLKIVRNDVNQHEYGHCDVGKATKLYYVPYGIGNKIRSIGIVHVCQCLSRQCVCVCIVKRKKRYGMSYIYMYIRVCIAVAAVVAAVISSSCASHMEYETPAFGIDSNVNIQHNI